MRSKETASGLRYKSLKIKHGMRTIFLLAIGVLRAHWRKLLSYV
jgi:hypothetical protein